MLERGCDSAVDFVSANSIFSFLLYFLPGRFGGGGRVELIPREFTVSGNVCHLRKLIECVVLVIVNREVV